MSIEGVNGAAGAGARATDGAAGASGSSAAALHPGLRRAYERIRDLLAKATRDEGRSRHEVGTIVSAVKQDSAKYGAQAVEQLARALGTNIHTLYRCAAVAECWSAAQLEALQARVNEHGQPLSWSHLVLISGVTSPKRRSDLVDRVLRDSLSVRELVVLVDEVSSPAEKTSALTVLHRFVRTAERFSQSAAEMQNELLAELEGGCSSGWNAAQLIERAIAANEQLQTVMQRQLQRLRSEKGRLARRGLDSAPRLLAGMPNR
jgi:hypothetical protein